MPIVGVVCGADGGYSSFEECLHRHENYSCQCAVIPLAIKMIRDNLIGRENAGISASTITGCAREYALMKEYDYYAPIPQYWVMNSGTIMHSALEGDDDPEWIMKERRVVRQITIEGKDVRLSGQMDRVDVKHKRLIDYKVKERVPWKPDPSHELQYNVYVFLLRDGTLLADREHPKEEPIQLDIQGGGMHYVSRNKTEPFKKISYPIWEEDRLLEVISERLKPILDYQESGELPECNAYQRYGKNWRCSCELIEEQLEDRGITVW